MDKTQKSAVLCVAALAAATLMLMLYLLHPTRNDGCDAVSYADWWMDKEITNHTDMETEIRGVIIDNRCDGITPLRLRKVLLDMDHLNAK